MNLKRLKLLALCILILSTLLTSALSEEETVTWRGITVSRDTEELDLGKTTVQNWNAFYDFLGQLPNLKKVDMFNEVLNLKVYKKLNELFPDVDPEKMLSMLTEEQTGTLPTGIYFYCKEQGT